MYCKPSSLDNTLHKSFHLIYFKFISFYLRIWTQQGQKNKVWAVSPAHIVETILVIITSSFISSYTAQKQKE